VPWASRFIPLKRFRSSTEEPWGATGMGGLADRLSVRLPCFQLIASVGNGGGAVGTVAPLEIGTHHRELNFGRGVTEQRIRNFAP